MKGLKITVNDASETKIVKAEKKKEEFKKQDKGGKE